jgi:hypothetical protein
VEEGSIQSDVTAAANLYATYAQTQSAAFTLTTLRHYYANGTAPFANVTAGGAITSQAGFQAESSLYGATANYGFLCSNIGGANATTGKSNYGFFSNVNAATGGGVAYGFIANGSAPNYFVGPLWLGGVPASATQPFYLSGVGLVG